MNIYDRQRMSELRPVLDILSKAQHPEPAAPPGLTSGAAQLAAMIRAQVAAKGKAALSPRVAALVAEIRGERRAKKTKDIPPGATTWADADAAAAAAKVQTTTDDFARLVMNAMTNPTITDKAAAMRRLTGEYEARVAAEVIDGR